MTASVDLSDERFVSLVTFRRNGEEVPTPVWFAGDSDGFYVGTASDSGKVKRIRANPAVRYAAANFRGLERSGYLDGVATILEGAAADRANEALGEEYGWQWTLFSRGVDCYLRVDRSS